jgi:hypothetical protein
VLRFQFDEVVRQPLPPNEIDAPIGRHEIRVTLTFHIAGALSLEYSRWTDRFGRVGGPTGDRRARSAIEAEARSDTVLAAFVL